MSRSRSNFEHAPLWHRKSINVSLLCKYYKTRNRLFTASEQKPKCHFSRTDPFTMSRSRSNSEHAPLWHRKSINVSLLCKYL